MVIISSKKYIYLIFSRTGTIFSRVINFGLSHKYAHVSLSFDSSLNVMYSFGRINPDNPFIAGLITENIDGGIFTKFPYSECMIYKVTVTEDQLNTLKKELKIFMNEQKKYRYNFLGVFTAYWDKPREKDYYYFCSQFVSELLIKSSIYESTKPPALISPKDLLAIDNKEIIYEGFVCNYSKSMHGGALVAY